MKKLVTILLAGAMALSMAGCGAEKATSGGMKTVRLETWPEDGKMIAAEVSYPENGSVEADEEVADNIWLEGDEHTVVFHIIEDEEYEESRDWAIDTEGEEWGCRPVKFQDYTAHAYIGMGEYNMVVLLEDEPSEKGYRYLEVDITTPVDSFEDPEVVEKYVDENEEIQQIFNSFKYLGEVDAPEEEF